MISISPLPKTVMDFKIFWIKHCLSEVKPGGGTLAFYIMAISQTPMNKEKHWITPTLAPPFFFSVITGQDWSMIFIEQWSVTSRKLLRIKVTPDLHLTYSKNGGNLGLVLKMKNIDCISILLTKHVNILIYNCLNLFYTVL